MNTLASNYTAFNYRNPDGQYHPSTSQKFNSVFMASKWNNFTKPLTTNYLQKCAVLFFRKSGIIWEQNAHSGNKISVLFPKYGTTYYILPAPYHFPHYN